MDLIQEEDGAAAFELEALGGFVHDLADALDAHGRRVLAHELALGVRGNELGERGLASAGRAVQDHARHGTGVEHAPQQLAGAQDVLLAGELSDGARAHACREGEHGLVRSLAGRGPEVGHSGR